MGALSDLTRPIVSRLVNTEATRREIDSNINIGLAMAVLFEGLIDHAERDKAARTARP